MEETLKLILENLNNMENRMNKRFDNMDSELKTVNSSLNVMEARLDKIEKTIKTEVLVVNNKLDDIRDDIANVESAIISNFSKIKKIEKAVSSSKTELETVKRVAYVTALGLSDLENNAPEI